MGKDGLDGAFLFEEGGGEGLEEGGVGGGVRCSRRDEGEEDWEC